MGLAAKLARRAKRIPLPKLVGTLGRIGTPDDERETRATRRLLIYAGYRAADAPLLFYGLKFGGALLLGGLYLLVALLAGALSPRGMLLIFLPLGAGYYLPDLVLKRQAAARQQRIVRELPDALDLLLICLEAGLGFDMALYRVSRELEDLAPVLSGEFAQYFFEIRGGLPKKTVLTHLAERNGVEPLSGVVNMLQQSARMGTDVAEGLRVHIGAMRTERRQVAEEKAARISTKLTFPMITLILPALFAVVLGPALINLVGRLKGGF